MKKLAMFFLILSTCNSTLAFDSFFLKRTNRYELGEMLVIKQGDSEFGDLYSKLSRSMLKEGFHFRLSYNNTNQKLYLSLDYLSALEGRLGLPEGNSAVLNQQSIFIFSGIPEVIEIKEKSDCQALIVAETRVLFSISKDEINKLFDL